MNQLPRNLIRLNPDEHASLKVQVPSDYRHLAETNSSAIVVEEVSDVACNFPIAFLRDEESGSFHLNALLGLYAGQNLFTDKTGEWTATYLPSGMSLLPFSFFVEPDVDDQLTLDVGSDLVSEEEGVSLFESGEPSQFLSRIREQVSKTVDGYLQTQHFTDLLINMNLLCEFSVELGSGGGEKTVIGDLYTINTAEFAFLSDEDILEFHKLNYWNAIYLIMHSLKQFKHMQGLHNRANKDQQIDLAINLIG